MSLSLCILSYNEENNIHYPLDSAIELVDEVILIDGGSTDNTVKIAKSYGEKVKVLVTDNPKNFLANKQKAIEKASGEWILQLDADEAVSDELKTELKTIIHRKFQNPKSKLQTNSNNQDINIGGYCIPRKNWFLGRFLMKGGVYPDYVLRLYKKEGAYFDLKDLHENVKIKGKTDYLKGAILHYADPTFSRYLMRWDRYTTFDADVLAQKLHVTSYMLHGLIFLDYCLVKPFVWFFMTYFRHKGFMDGFQGFVFSFFSSLRFMVIYIKAVTHLP